MGSVRSRCTTCSGENKRNDLHIKNIAENQQNVNKIENIATTETSIAGPIKSGFTNMRQYDNFGNMGFRNTSQLDSLIKDLSDKVRYVNDVKIDFDKEIYTATISNIKANDMSENAGSVKQELATQEKIFNDNYIKFRNQKIDDLITKIKEEQNSTKNALKSAKESINTSINTSNTKNQLNIANEDLNQINFLIKNAEYRVKAAGVAYVNMESAVNAIHKIIDTPCAYNDAANWSTCQSNQCKLGDVTVKSTIKQQKTIKNWKCNSNGNVVYGTNAKGRYIGETKDCDYTCPCVYSSVETPVDMNSCSRTCSPSSRAEDLESYRKEALWNVYHKLDSGPGSCPSQCDKIGKQTKCKNITVGKCDLYPAPICSPVGFKGVSGFTTMTEGFSALANRPLEGIKHECPCKMAGRNDLSSVKPFYNDGEYSSSVSNDRSKEIPIILQKHRNQYFALQDGGNNSDVYSDSWADIPTEQKVKKEKKMDVITQFYFGSLSIVALFIVFRMIQKSK